MHNVCCVCSVIKYTARCTDMIGRFIFWWHRKDFKTDEIYNIASLLSQLPSVVHTLHKYYYTWRVFVVLLNTPKCTNLIGQFVFRCQIYKGKISKLTRSVIVSCLLSSVMHTLLINVTLYGRTEVGTKCFELWWTLQVSKVRKVLFRVYKEIQLVTINNPKFPWS